MEGDTRLQAWETCFGASFLVSALRLRAGGAREVTGVAKMGWAGLSQASHSPEGQANRSQGSPHLLWPLWRAQDAGPLQLSCRTNKSLPGEGRERIRKAPSSHGVGGSQGVPLPSLLWRLGCQGLPTGRKGLWAETGPVGAPQTS